MRALPFIGLVVLAAAVVAVSATGIPAGDDGGADLKLSSVQPPVDLTDSTFDSATQVDMGMTAGNWFVMFYAPWCGHCRHLKPVWDELATQTPGHGATIARVDCDTNAATCRRFGVRGYPTLIYFARGKMYRFEGRRQLESLVDFITTDHRKKEGSLIPGPQTWAADAAFWVSAVSDEFAALYRDQPVIVGGMVAVMLVFLPLVFFLAIRQTDVQRRSPTTARPAAPKPKSQ